MNSRQRKRLQRLLDVRRLKEAARRQDLGLAMREEQRAVELENQSRAQLDQARTGAVAALSAGGLTPRRLRQLHEEVRFRERMTERSADRRLRESALRERAEQAYRAARRDSRSLERLQERQREVDARDRKRAEQSAADEVALRRYLDQTEANGAPDASAAVNRG